MSCLANGKASLSAPTLTSLPWGHDQPTVIVTSLMACLNPLDLNFHIRSLPPWQPDCFMGRVKVDSITEGCSWGYPCTFSLPVVLIELLKKITPPGAPTDLWSVHGKCLHIVGWPRGYTSRCHCPCCSLVSGRLPTLDESHGLSRATLTSQLTLAL